MGLDKLKIQGNKILQPFISHPHHPSRNEFPAQKLIVFNICVLHYNWMCSSGDVLSPCSCAHPRVATLETCGLCLCVSTLLPFPDIISPTSGSSKVLIQAGALSFVGLCALTWKYFFNYLNGESMDLCSCHSSFPLDFFFFKKKNKFFLFFLDVDHF